MLSELKRYRDIVFYRILAQLKSEARQNYLGYLWFALEPLLMTGIFFFVFGVMLGNRSPEYLWFLIVGLTSWQWFEASLNEGMFGIKSKLHILAQMPLPKTLFPLVHVGSALWRYLCVLGLLLVVRACFGGLHAALWALPIVMLGQLTIIVGLVWLLAIAVSYFEDAQKITQAFFKFLFYLSGIFFAVDKIPAYLLPLFYSNPLAGLLSCYRAIIIEGQLPDWGLVAYAYVWGLSLMLIGYRVCVYFDKRLLKEVVA